MGIIKRKTTVVNVVSNIAPFVLACPAAYSIYRGSIRALEYPQFVAAFAALGVEALGISAMNIALDMYTYNTQRKQNEMAAPTKMAVIAVIVYAVIAVTMTVIAEMVTGARYLSFLYPMAGMTGYFVLALRVTLNGIIESVQESREAAKLAREQRKAALSVSDSAQIQSENTRITNDFAQFAQSNGDKRDGRVNIRATIREFNAEVAKLNDGRAKFVSELRKPGTNRAKIVAEFMQSRGYDVPPESTLRYWADKLLREYEHA